VGVLKKNRLTVMGRSPGLSSASLVQIKFFLLHSIPGEDVCGGSSRKNGMYDLRVRRDPEGRRLNETPARKGWGIEGG
jgi:hypothetical protein